MESDIGDFINNLKQTYVSQIDGKLPPEQERIAISTLDDAIKIVNDPKENLPVDVVNISSINIDKYVDELTNTNIYSHGLAGKFGRALRNESIGFGTEQAIGPNAKWLYINMDSQNEYYFLFQSNDARDGPEFRARIAETKYEDGTSFKMMFNDKKWGDERGGCHTDYGLFIPKNKVKEIVPVIENRPEILIKLFQKIYPKYDQSNGKLRIDTEYLKEIGSTF